MENAHKMSE
jgi:hypothetical protein